MLLMQLIMDLKLSLRQKKLLLILTGKIILTNTDETNFARKSGNDFYRAGFYDLALVVQEIVNQEARFCHFENLGFMVFILSLI